MNNLVVLNPGHGGSDPGAIGPNGAKEKDANLMIAFCTKMELERRGFRVYMTRYQDEFISLQQTCTIANREEADLFVSIHCNGAHASTAHGIETFHHPTSRKGIHYAKYVQAAMIEHTRRRDRGVKHGNFKVLRDTKMPAVLVECGFITNPEEEKMLVSIPYQVLIGRAIAEGILQASK